MIWKAYPLSNEDDLVVSILNEMLKNFAIQLKNNFYLIQLWYLDNFGMTTKYKDNLIFLLLRTKIYIFT